MPKSTLHTGLQSFGEVTVGGGLVENSRPSSGVSVSALGLGHVDSLVSLFLATHWTSRWPLHPWETFFLLEYGWEESTKAGISIQNELFLNPTGDTVFLSCEGTSCRPART